MSRCVWIRVWSPRPYSHHRDPSVGPALCTAVPRTRVYGPGALPPPWLCVCFLPLVMLAFICASGSYPPF